MKVRVFSRFATLICMVLVCVFGAGGAPLFAQEPPGSPQVPPAPQEPPLAGLEGKPFAPFAPAPEMGVQSASAAAIPLGQPGLSFRYVQTFGVVEEGYIADNTHHYNPWGITTDGNSVWIAEMYGNRAVKFDNAGNCQGQIGKASFREATGTSLARLTDVAVDGDGNVWIVDADATHVVKFDSSGKVLMELGDRWDSGSSNDRFDGPASVAFDAAGNIFVSDGNNARIQIFDSTGNYQATLGVTGQTGSDNSHFNGPEHVFIVGNQLYVADSGNHRVQIFSISSPYAPVWEATIGVSGQEGSDNNHLSWPTGVAVDASYIYVADSGNNRVQIFSRSTRAYVATVGTGSGIGDYQFHTPTDVAVDAAGNLYVADVYNNRVQQYNSGWVYQRTYGTTGVPYLTDGYHYNYPTGVAVAGDGSIYVVESRGKRLVKLNAAGVPQWTVGEPGISGTDNSHFRYPQGVALDGAGHVYVADTSNDRIQIFNSDGTYYATLGTGSGSGPYQFDSPYGVAVGQNGNIYVADRYNHRIQIYNADGAYIGTIGTTGVAGSDNSHFNEPHDVAVDSAGNVYVADLSNHRVQKCASGGSGWTCTTIAGETGVSGSDFGHLSNPIGVTVDAAGRLYIADGWGGRVQVFDSSGAYLTTIGGSWGNRTGQMRQADGLAVDNAGNLYIAEYLNHRIQKFAPGVPGWKQVNINGFGERQQGINTLAPFGNALYAGTYNWSGNGAQLWRMDAGGNWTPMITTGFGITRNVGIGHLLEFNGQLYAGTSADSVHGGEVWRSSDGSNWNRVVSQGFGDPTNGEVMRLGVFNGQLYAATWSYTSTHGAEIWRSSTGDSGSWTQVVSNGLGDAANRAVLTMEEFNGALYAGTRSYIGGTYTGAEVWRTADGLTWTAVITNGFGYTGTYDVSALEVFGGYLYAGTGRYDLSAQSYPGGQIWRCSQASGCDEPGDWEVVIADGFGHPDNIDITSLLVFGSHLYALAYNFQTGMEVWRTADGITWEQAGFAGFGDSNNYGPYWDNSATVFNNRLFIGTYNPANGGEVWEMQSMPQALVTIADPGQSYTLEFDYANGGKSTVGIPANLLPAGSTLVYAPFNLGWRPPNHRLAGRAFQLSVYQGGVLQENLSLSSPLQVTIDYTDGEVWGLDEDLLVLLRWEPSTQSWVDAACGQYDRQPAQNRISVPVCHLSLFGLFGEQEYIYLPVIRR